MIIYVVSFVEDTGLRCNNSERY